MECFPQCVHLTDEVKEQSTVEDPLTIRSELAWNEWDVPLTDVDNNDLIQLFVVDDPLEYILAKPAIYEPGTYWYYSGGDVNLHGEFFEQATQMSIDQFARTHLFEPLGITDYRWRCINPEIVYASGELELRPRDLAKFGSLYLNRGMWQGTRVISDAWVEASIQEHASIPGRSSDGDGYGYQWFTGTYNSNSASVAAAVRTGWGGQALIVFPDHSSGAFPAQGPFIAGYSRRGRIQPERSWEVDRMLRRSRPAEDDRIPRQIVVPRIIFIGLAVMIFGAVASAAAYYYETRILDGGEELPLFELFSDAFKVGLGAFIGVLSQWGSKVFADQGAQVHPNRPVSQG